MTTSNSVLTPAEFDSLFDTFRSTVVRLEAHASYAVGGAEEQRLNAWRAGDPRPERNVRTDPWLARIAVSTVLAGKTWSRVRVLDDPLTDYQLYQLESYRESQAVGERIHLVSRPVAGDVGADVWLFDAGAAAACAVLMHYHPDGRLDRRELVDDGWLIEHLAAGVQRVLDLAVPLNTFLAAAGG